MENDVKRIANDVIDNQFIDENEREVLARVLIDIFFMADNCDTDPVCSTCHWIRTTYGSD